jgi:hypothetical protein
VTPRRRQILDTAADLFAASGFHGVSVGDIGAAVEGLAARARLVLETGEAPPETRGEVREVGQNRKETGSRYKPGYYETIYSNYEAYVK